MNTKKIQALFVALKQGKLDQAEAVAKLRTVLHELEEDIKVKGDLLRECQKIFSVVANPGYPEKQRAAVEAQAAE